MTYNLPRRTLVSQTDASILKRPDVPRAQFKNRYGHKTAFDAGLLIPIEVDEILPGDHVRYQMHAAIRLDTPYFPLMDGQRIDVHAFYVPNRILWTNWTRMLGAQDNPGDSTDYETPIINSSTIPTNGPEVGSLFDYFGIPTEGQITAGLGTNLVINGLPIRAYHRIWNEWYRSQDLQNSTPVGLATNDTPISYTSANVLLPRNKSHDFFTMALPSPQKGTALDVPLGGLAPVLGLGLDASDRTGTSSGANYVETDGNTQTYDFLRNLSTQPVYAKLSAATGAEPEIYADLAQATGMSIQLFRQAIMVQTLLEQSARGGTRYVEQMMSIWGVRPPDYRVQRPEYIGGGSMELNITPVASTDGTTDPLGTLGAAGTANGKITASYTATEHGFVIFLMSVKTELSYQQGMHQLWHRRTRYDYPVPAFAGLTEQPIYRRELYLTGDPASDTTVFGFVPRYEEYRTRYSRVSGIFRSTAAGTLDAWHFAENFTTAPVLGNTFIRDTPPMDRVLVAGELAQGQQYKADILFDRVITRPLPAWGIPATLGRL